MARGCAVGGACSRLFAMAGGAAAAAKGVATLAGRGGGQDPVRPPLDSDGGIAQQCQSCRQLLNQRHEETTPPPWMVSNQSRAAARRSHASASATALHVASRVRDATNAAAERLLRRRAESVTLLPSARRLRALEGLARVQARDMKDVRAAQPRERAAALATHAERCHADGALQLEPQLVAAPRRRRRRGHFQT